MAYIGYCIKFNLYTYHSMVIDGNIGESHPHTFNISVDINYEEGTFFKFDEIEGLINGILDKYQSKYLNETPPFDLIPPTLENVGDHLFVEINEALKEKGFEVSKLSISETPTRTYFVDKESLERKRNSTGPLINTVAYIRDVIEYLAEDFTSSHKPEINEKSIISEPESEKLEQEEPEELPTAAGIDLPTSVDESGEPEAQKSRYFALKITASVIAIVFCALFLIWYINLHGNYPWGSDTFGHIFKSDLLYKSIKEGDLYPLYTQLWYNGIQPFRYWAPIPYYFMALMQFMTNGNPIWAYNLFIAATFIIGSLGWLLIGIKEKRIFLATFLGILFFIMPDNIRIFFSEGNIPRVVVTMFVPYLIYFVWLFTEYEKKHMIIPVILTLCVITLCHLMMTAMLIVTIFLFLLIYGFINKKYFASLQFAVASAVSLALCGIWLYPALQGGIFAIDTSAVAEVMKALTFPFTQSLNPFMRLSNIEIFYFGLSFILISIMGIFLSNKKSIPGFATLIIIFLGTTTAFVPFLMKLPLNQVFWMMRFTPFAYAVFLIALLQWRNIKRYAMIIIAVVLLLDSFVSFNLLAFNSSPSYEITAMLDDAKKNTSQRIAIMDLSEFGSYPSYYICNGKDNKLYAFGWAWQGANTAQNIVMLNTALEKEYYTYMFDRALEMGCDTVLVKKGKVKSLEKLYTAAIANNYNLVKEYNLAYLFKRETPESFGVKVKYYGLAVGKTAANIVLEFPGFEIASDDYLDNYTVEELKQYEVIYLSEFKYKDKDTAEELVIKAANSGVQIVVDMDRVPNDPLTNRLTFLGITAQPIQFEYQLPPLHVQEVVRFPVTFKKEHKIWNTVYLENVPNPLGFSWFGGNKLVFIGQHENRNITFVAFNILYHGIENKDQEVIDIFGTAIGKMQNQLPYREIVPIDIEFRKNSISISSPEKDVCTTLANLDAFVTKDKVYSKHNLMFISNNKAEITVTYPYLKQGIALSAVGFVLAAFFIYFVLKKRGVKK